MSLREQVAQELHYLGDGELKQVADYLEFLKFQSRAHPAPALDARQMAALYAEFAEEDRSMAEEGFAEYAHGLSKEDGA
jgi:hypothetical protein